MYKKLIICSLIAVSALPSMAMRKSLQEMIWDDKEKESPSFSPVQKKVTSMKEISWGDEERQGLAQKMFESQKHITNIFDWQTQKIEALTDENHHLKSVLSEKDAVLEEKQSTILALQDSVEKKNNEICALNTQLSDNKISLEQALFKQAELLSEVGQYKEKISVIKKALG